MTKTEVSELDRPLFIAAALRGFRLQHLAMRAGLMDRITVAMRGAKE